MAARMIEEFYNDMDYDSKKEALSMKLSVSSKASDVTMLDAIAKNFGRTRTEIVSELLNTIVLEMVFSLTPEDQEKLSEIADKETTAYYTKRGVTQTYCGVGLEKGEKTNEDMSWRSFNALIKQKKDEKNADS